MDVAGRCAGRPDRDGGGVTVDAINVLVDAINVLIEIITALGATLRRAIPNFDTWIWLGLLILAIALGVRHVAAHMRRGRVSVGGAVLGIQSHTDESGASLFRSARAVERRPSLSPFYGKPAWLRGLPLPIAVVIAWLWVYARPVVVVLGVALVIAVGVRLYRAVATWRHRREIVRPLAAVLAPALETRRDEVLRGLVVPRDWRDEDAEVKVPLPDDHRPDQVTQVARLVANRLGGDWTHSRTSRAPYVLTFRHKPAPPSYLEYRDVAHLLRQGSLESPLMGLGCGLEQIRISFGGEVAHLGMSAGTGAGKSSLMRLLVAQLAYHGVRDFVAIDTKLVSFAGLEDVPGMRIYNGHITEMWTAIEEVRMEMDERYEYLKRNPGAKFLPKFLLLEEQNDFALETRLVWEEIKTKGDKSKAPVWNDIARILLKARQVNIRVIGVYQRMTAEVAGGASDGTLRDMYGDKVLARFSHQAWDSLVGTRPRAQSSEIPGRWVHVRGSLHRQVQVPYIDGEDVADLLSTAPAVTTAGPPPAVTSRHVPRTVPYQAGRAPYEVTALYGDMRDRDGALTAGTQTRGALPPTPGPDRAPTAISEPSGAINSRPRRKGPPSLPSPRFYTLEEACKGGIIPLSYEAAKRRRTRAKEAGKPFPQGRQKGRATVYTEEELREWWQAEQRREKGSS